MAMASSTSTNMVAGAVAVAARVAASAAMATPEPLPAYFPLDAVTAVMASPAWAASGTDEHEDIVEPNIENANSDNGMHDGAKDVTMVPTFVKPHLAGEDVVVLTKIQAVHEGIIEALQAAGIMFAKSNQNTNNPRENKGTTTTTTPTAQQTNATVADSLGVNLDPHGSFATPTDDVTVAQQRQQQQHQRTQQHVQPMTPMSATQNIHQIVIDVERQRENLIKHNKTSATGAEQTHKDIDRSYEEIKSLREMVTHLQTQIHNVTATQIFDVSTPIAKELRFTPDDTQNHEHNDHEYTTRLSTTAAAAATAYAATQHAQTTIATQDHDNDKRQGGHGKVAYLMQYRAQGINYDDLREGTRKAVTLAIRDLITLANGLDDSEVIVTLSQGSLIPDAQAMMPTEDVEPVLPGARAVQRVIGGITGQRATVTEPRMMRASADDELWTIDRPQTPHAGPAVGGREVGPQGLTEGAAAAGTALGVGPGRRAIEVNTLKFGMPRSLNFEAATDATQESQAEQEKVRAASQIKQPELTRIEQIWPEETEEADDNGGRHRATNWNLVPERQTNLAILRG